MARGVVLTDAAYGSDGGFRAGVTVGLTYAVAVQSTISVWPPGMEPLPPKPSSGRGRKPSRARRERGRSSAGLGQDADDDAAAGDLVRGVLARGLEPNPDLALRRGADAAGLARREAHGPRSNGC